MAMNRLDRQLNLSALLEPLSVSEFRREFLGKKAIHIKGDPDRFASLFGWSQFNRLLNSSPKTLPIPSLIDKTNELFELLNKSEDFQDSKAVTPALLLAHIRMARMGNLSLGQFLENAISLWSVEAAIEESESSKEKKH